MIEQSIVHLPVLVKDIDWPVSIYLVHLSSLYYFVASSGSAELLLSVAFSELLLGSGLLVPPDGVPCLLGALAPPADGFCSDCGTCSPEPGFTAGSSPVMTGVF